MQRRHRTINSVIRSGLGATALWKTKNLAVVSPPNPTNGSSKNIKIHFLNRILAVCLNVAFLGFRPKVVSVSTWIDIVFIDMSAENDFFQYWLWKKYPVSSISPLIILCPQQSNIRDFRLSEFISPILDVNYFYSSPLLSRQTIPL